MPSHYTAVSIVRAACTLLLSCALAFSAGCAQPPPGGPVETVIKPDESRWTAEANAKLKKVLPKVQFAGIGFGDVIQFFRDATKLNIHPKWEALRAANIDQKTPVNVTLTDVTVGKALRTVLDDVGGVVALDYVIDEGVLTISTKDDLSRQTVTVVYNVADLAGAWSLTAAERGEIRLLLREVMLRDIGPTDRKVDEGTAPDLALAYRKRVDELAGVVHRAFRRHAAEEFADLIRALVMPEIWRGCGGMIGSIRIYRSSLVVTAPPATHRQVRWLLEALRVKPGDRT